MSNSVFVMPFVATTPGLPTVNPADLVPYADYETGALEHWIFGSDNTSLVGLVNGLQLIPQSDDHVFTEDSVQLPGFGGALESAIPDDSVNRTFFAVVKVPQQSSQADRGVYWGTRAFGTGAPNGGIMIQANYFSSGSVNTAATTESGTRSTSSTTYPSVGSAIGDWVFVLISESDDDMLTQINGSQVSEELVADRLLSSLPWALGNAHYANPDWQNLQLEFAEWGCIDSATGDADAMALYNRAKARCARRGIEIA